MSETKFTPGPWYADGVYVCDSDDNNICDLEQENWEPNSYLIAAAPDLYEALEEVLLAERFSNRPPVTVYQAEEKLDRIKYAVNKAEAALAKARGEQ